VRSAPLLLLLAASAGAEPRPKLAAHYAALFENGRTWVYDTSLTFYSGSEDEHTHKMLKQTDRSTVTCKVADVVTRKSALVSHITCAPDSNRKFHVDGYWAGTAKGLWSLGRDEAPGDDELAEILKDPPVIAAAPKAFRKVEKDKDSLDTKHNEFIHGIKAAPGGWCVFADSTNGDPDGGVQTTCYIAGVGIANSLDDIGGELNRFEYTARRK